MKALDAYRDLLRELDKHESPTFTIGDFNYFFNESVQKYITENYKDIDPVHTFTEVRREKSAQRGTKNAYRKTSFLRPYYKMDIDSIYAILDTDVVELVSGKMDYIRKHTAVYLNPDKGSDYDSDPNNTTIDFPDYVISEIVGVCRIMFLENTENQRFQTSIIENQVKSE